MRRIALALTLLLLLLVAAPLALLGALRTEGGTRWALAQLQQRLPALSIEHVEGSAWGPLRLTGLRYRADGVEAELDWLELQWTPTALLYRELHIRRLAGGQLQLRLGERPDDPEDRPLPTRLPLDVRLDRGTLARLQVQRGEAAPVAAQGLSVAGRWTDNRLQLTGAGATLLAPALGNLQASGTARLEPDAVHLRDVRLQGPGWLRLEGRLSPAGDSRLQLQWRDLRWPLVEAPALLRSATGQARIEGRPEAWRFSLAATLAEARASLQLEAAGEGNGAGLRLERLHAAGLGGTLQAQAALQWSPQLQLDASGAFRGLQPQAVLPVLDGVFNGRFSVQTTLRAGAPALRFEAALEDSRWQGHVLQASAAGVYEQDRLTLSRGEVRTAGNRLTLTGQLWPTLAARVHLDAPALARLWPGLAGEARVDLRLRGPLQGPAVTGSAALRALAFRELAIARLDFEGGIDLRGQRRWERVALQSRLTAQGIAWGAMEAARVSLHGRLDPLGRSDLNLALQDAQLGLAVPEADLGLVGTAAEHALTARLRTERGDADLELAGAAQLSRRRWQGALRSAELRPNGLPEWRLEQAAELRLSPATQSVGAHCWASAGARLCSSAERDHRGVRAEAELAPLPLAYLQPVLPPQWRLEGEIRGGGTVALGPQGQLERVQLRLTSSAGRWLQQGRELLSFSPANLLLEQAPGGPLAAQAQLPFSGGIARLDARLAPGAVLTERALQGNLHLDVPELSWLRMFTTEFSAVSGRLQGQYTLGGRLAAPRMEGALTLSDGRLRLARAGIELTDLQAVLRGDADGQLRLALSGRSGGGALHVDGELSPEARPPSGRFRIQGSGFQVVRLPDARVWVSPDLQVRLSGRQLEVRGEVQVPRAEITPTTGGRGIAPSADQIIVGTDDAAPSTPLLQFLAEIRLVLGEQVRFKGYGLEAPLGGDLTLVQQGGGEARAFGEIQLDGGKYQAYGQDLTITTGRLIYSGGYVSQPALDLRAERKPTEEVTVGVTVRGTLDKPQFALFSTPAMTQQQQLSWLVLGRPLEQSGNEGEQSRLNAAALSLGLSGGDYLAQRLRTRLGVDEISIGARPTEGAEQARLTLGKHLSPRLYISYGVGLFEAGNVFRLLYDLGRGFKLQTESGVESGVDLLYTLER